MRLCNVSSAGFAGILAILLCSTAIPAVAQSSPSNNSAAKPQTTTTSAEQSQSPAVYKSTAALVLVDVLVSNGQEPIHGIPRSQFRLLEDGKEQKLVALEEHKPSDPASVHPPPALPPHIYSNIPETQVPSVVNVLLLDALNTPIADQARVRQQMITYLKTISPGTRIGIFTLASRLRLVQGITSDSRPLLAALNGKGAAGKSALPTQSVLLPDQFDPTNADMSDTLSQIQANADVASSIQQFQADTAAFQTDLRVRYTLDALQQLAKYLRGIPGRKNLIWFSGSFPLNLDPDSTLQSPFEAMRVYSQQVSETTAMLASSRVAVYPVDARGLMNDPQYDVRTSSSGMNTGSGKNPPAFTQRSTKFFQQTASEHATMQQIAEETGGRAYYDTNGIAEAVAQAVETGSNYYTLAYAPESKTNDGRFHKIQVTIPEAPSYKLTYRNGYVAESPKKRSDNAPVASVTAAALRGAPPYSEIVFKVRVLPFSDAALSGVKPLPSPVGDVSPKVKGPLAPYSLDYAADVHNVTFAETSDGLHQGVFEFLVIAYDRDGARLNYVDKAFRVSINDDQLQQAMLKGMQIHQQVDLPAGEVYLRATIHDLVSDHVGAVEIPLMVKARD
jgi:VWFA-related protein